MIRPLRLPAHWRAPRMAGAGNGKPVRIGRAMFGRQRLGRRVEAMSWPEGLNEKEKRPDTTPASFQHTFEKSLLNHCVQLKIVYPIRVFPHVTRCGYVAGTMLMRKASRPARCQIDARPISKRW